MWTPKRRPRRERWLTPQEAARLVRHCWHHRERQQGKVTAKAPRQHIAKFIIVALRTGRRAGAIVQAKLGKSKDSTYVDTGMLMPKLGHVQTKKQQPPIPLPDRLLAYFRRWHRMGQHHVIEWNGEPISRMNVGFRTAARDAGLPDVTPHTLRHTAATWGMQRVERASDIWALSGYLGMSVKTLTTIYGHHAPEHLRTAAVLFNRPGNTPVAATDGREQKRPKVAGNGARRPAKARSPN